MEREKYKNILLISLFLLCILLSGKILLGGFVKNEVLKSDEVVYKSFSDVQKVLSPQSYFVSFGGNLHTGLYSEDINRIIWDKTKENLKIYLLGLKYEEISVSKWNQLVKERSFRFELPFNYKIGDIYLILGIPKKDDKFMEKYVDTIIMPTNNTNQIYLGSEANSSFYILKGLDRNGEYEFKKIVENIEKSNIIEYKRLEDIFSLRNLLNKKEDEAFKENSTIAPITGISDVSIINVSNSFDDMDIKLYAEKVFDENFNFVKKIKDIDDSIIYMYGYGDKILKFYKNGSLEYSEKLSEINNNDKTDIVDYINISLNGIEKFGDIPSNLYLSGYSKNQDEEVLYFNFRIKGYNVFSNDIEGGSAYKIVIKDNKMVYFKRNIKKYVSFRELQKSNGYQTKSVDEVIEKNIDVILNRYTREKDIMLTDENKTEIIINILQDINKIDIEYFNSKNDTANLMYPVWEIKISNTIYCFDLYTGDILYSSN